MSKELEMMGRSNVMDGAKEKARKAERGIYASSDRFRCGDQAGNRIEQVRSSAIPAEELLLKGMSFGRLSDLLSYLSQKFGS